MELIKIELFKFLRADLYQPQMNIQFFILHVVLIMNGLPCLLHAGIFVEPEDLLFDTQFDLLTITAVLLNRFPER
jgi:hypothetical protein